MPADHLSRLPSANDTKITQITECFDPFQPDLKDLQRTDTQLQNMNHFRVHGQWLTPVPKAESTYLQNLAPKLFQDSQNMVWVRLDDYKYPRTALFLPQKYRKLVLCEAHNNQFGGHNAALKTYIQISSSYFWPKMYSDVLSHTKTCLRCQQRKNQQTSHCYCNHCQLRTSPTSGFMQTFSAQCSLPDGSTNTFFASLTHL